MAIIYPRSESTPQEKAEAESLIEALKRRFDIGPITAGDVGNDVYLTDGIEPESLGCTLRELAEFLLQEGREQAAQAIEAEAREYEKQFGVHGAGGAQSGVLFLASEIARKGVE